MSAVTPDQLYLAIRSGMAALTVSLNCSYKLLQALTLTKSISPEAARLLWAEFQEDARRAVQSSPELLAAVDKLIATNPADFRT
jgi:hypothetical protein